MINDNNNSMPLRHLGIFSLLMIAIVSVDSIRNLPIAAQYGVSLITFYLIAAVGFFIPLIIVIRLLAVRYPTTGGSYIWIQAAFGERLGFISIWLQWIYNIIWYPTIFAFISTVLASLLMHGYETNRFFILGCSLILFWLVTAINCLGIRTVGWLSALYAILGTLLPMAVIIVLAALWLWEGHPSATPITWHALIPNHDHMLNLTYFVNILFSLLGLDVIAMHAGDVKRPERTYTIVLALAGVIIVLSLVLSSLAICVVVSPKQIGLLSGLTDAFNLFFARYHWPLGSELMGIAIILGALGTATSWIVGLARGLQVAASSPVSRLPASLQKLNRHQMPVVIFMLQGVIFTLLMSVFLIFPNINHSYWILSSMTAQFALIYYVILFCAAFALLRRQGMSKRALSFLILPVVTSAVGIVVGFLPPADLLGLAAQVRYELLLAFGMIIFLLPLFFILNGIRMAKGSTFRR